jgi:hypothetical protein
MREIFLVGITVEDLVTMIAGSLSYPLKYDIIDRLELCRRLNITQPTCIKFEKSGLIPALRIGETIRYNWPQVIQQLEAASQLLISENKNSKQNDNSNEEQN